MEELRRPLSASGAMVVNLMIVFAMGCLAGVVGGTMMTCVLCIALGILDNKSADNWDCEGTEI